MSIVLLDAMENENRISNTLVEMCKASGKDLSRFTLTDMNILPCRSCGACGFKSPGKCVVKDDIHEILRAIAKCSMVVLLTPIRFGGYSSCLKKAVDKFMSLCLPTYTVEHGHLLHPARYGSKILLGIGAYDGHSKDQEESFKRLVENNALNLQYVPKALVLKSSEDLEKVQNEITNLLREVCE